MSLRNRRMVLMVTIRVESWPSETSRNFLDMKRMTVIRRHWKRTGRSWISNSSRSLSFATSSISIWAQATSSHPVSLTLARRNCWAVWRLEQPRASTKASCGFYAWTKLLSRWRRSSRFLLVCVETSLTSLNDSSLPTSSVNSCSKCAALKLTWAGKSRTCSTSLARPSRSRPRTWSRMNLTKVSVANILLVFTC